MNADSTSNSTIPPVALYLGLAGLIPFVTTAILVWLALPTWSDKALLALIAYGAVILSFLGGVRWGAVLSDAQALTRLSPLAWAVAPSILAWVALLFEPRIGLVLLILGLAAQYLLDRHAAGATLLPRWYGRLRTLLSGGAIASLLVATAGMQ